MKHEGEILGQRLVLQIQTVSMSEQGFQHCCNNCHPACQPARTQPVCHCLQTFNVKRRVLPALAEPPGGLQMGIVSFSVSQTVCESHTITQAIKQAATPHYYLSF